MWTEVILWVATTVLSAMLKPKPPSPPRPKASDIRMPVAQEGKEFGWLFGTRDIPLNIVWWGHLKTQAVKAKGGKK